VGHLKVGTGICHESQQNHEDPQTLYPITSSIFEPSTSRI